MYLQFQRQQSHLATRAFFIFVSLLLPFSSQADDSYALTLYLGKYSDDKLGHVLLSKPVDFYDSYLATVALSKAYQLQNPSHQWEIEAQLAKHYRSQDHLEFNLLAIYRWNRFPWNNHLRTTFAIGDGLSYASEIPKLEASSPSNVGATRLLNYIMVEMSVAPPFTEDWALVTRVHHRSGVYGLFNDVEGGSNVVAAGIKILFD